MLVRPRPGHPTEVIVSHEGRVLRAAMGRSGIAALKREGDGATPRGRVTPLAALTRRPVPLPLPQRPARAQDGWCDAPASGRYNAYVKCPFAASHESLLRADGLYDVVVVTDHNQRPRVAGGGSAIFFHVTRPGARGADLRPTEGCLAFPQAAWQRAVVPLSTYLIGIDPRPCR